MHSLKSLLKQPIIKKQIGWHNGRACQSQQILLFPVVELQERKIRLSLFFVQIHLRFYCLPKQSCRHDLLYLGLLWRQLGYQEGVMSQMQFSAVKFKIAPLQSTFIISLSACTVLLFSSLFWGGSADPKRLLETIFFPCNLSISFFFLFCLLRHSELSLLCALLRGMSTLLWKYFVLLYRDTWKKQLQNRIGLFPYMRGTHNPWHLQPRLGTNLPWKIKSQCDNYMLVQYHKSILTDTVFNEDMV